MPEEKIGNPAKLPANVIWLSIVSMFNDIGSEILLRVLPLYLSAVIGALIAAGVLYGIGSISTNGKIDAHVFNSRVTIAIIPAAIAVFIAFFLVHEKKKHAKITAATPKITFRAVGKDFKTYLLIL